MPIHGKFDAPGYSYSYCGGDATYVIIPTEVMETDCLLEYNGDAYFLWQSGRTHVVHYRSLSLQVTTHDTEVYVHQMDIMQGGRMAHISGAGHMAAWE